MAFYLARARNISGFPRHGQIFEFQAKIRPVTSCAPVLFTSSFRLICISSGEDAIAELDASEDADDSTLLSKFTFNISCFEDDHKNEIHSLIEEYGGRIVGSHSDCDYKIAPLIYETKRKVAENEVNVSLAVLYLLICACWPSQRSNIKNNSNNMVLF